MVLKMRSTIFLLLTLLITSGGFSAIEVKDPADPFFSYNEEKIFSLQNHASQATSKDSTLVKDFETGQDIVCKLISHFNPDPRMLEKGLYKTYEREIFGLMVDYTETKSQKIGRKIETFYMAPWLSLSNIALDPYSSQQDILFSLVALVEIRHLEPFVDVYKEFLQKTKIIQDVDSLIGKFQKSCKTS